MKFIRNSSEDEMILEYLMTEYSSDKFSMKIQESMKKLGLEKDIILKPNLHSTPEK